MGSQIQEEVIRDPVGVTKVKGHDLRRRSYVTPVRGSPRIKFFSRRVFCREGGKMQGPMEIAL